MQKMRLTLMPFRPLQSRTDIEARIVAAHSCWHLQWKRKSARPPWLAPHLKSICHLVTRLAEVELAKSDGSKQWLLHACHSFFFDLLPDYPKKSDLNCCSIHDSTSFPFGSRMTTPNLQKSVPFRCPPTLCYCTPGSNWTTEVATIVASSLAPPIAALMPLD